MPMQLAQREINFFNRIFSNHLELVPFIQTAIGYSLTGSVEEQCLFICYGQGQNGKSTFLNAVRSCLGDYAQQAQTSLLISNNKVGNGEDVASLFGSRFVATIETKDGGSFDDAKVKMLTGGDRIRARNLYENSWEFSPTHKIWFATNHLPKINGADYAMERRLRLLPFDAVISDNEKDLKLWEKLQSEQDGIMAWAIDGLRAWRASGLPIPQIVKDKRKEYCASNDNFGQFINEVFVKDENASIKSSQAFALYEQWMKDNGYEHNMSKQSFAKKLKDREYEQLKKSDGAYWRGLGLLEFTKDNSNLANEDKPF